MARFTLVDSPSPSSQNIFEIYLFYSQLVI